MKTEIPSEALEQMKREGWPSIEEQKKYWQKYSPLQDAMKTLQKIADEGNYGYEPAEACLERIEATCDWFDNCSLADQETDAERNI